jgi:hypothetical protein
LVGLFTRLNSGKAPPRAVVWSARVFFDPTQQFLTEISWWALLGGAWL